MEQKLVAIVCNKLTLIKAVDNQLATQSDRLSARGALHFSYIALLMNSVIIFTAPMLSSERCEEIIYDWLTLTDYG
jgi:hypothetical protein